MPFAKIMSLGSRVVDTTFEYPTTIREILENEGVDYTNCKITLDGVVVSPNMEVSPDGNGFEHPRRIILSKNVKAGLNTVKVCLLGGTAQEVVPDENWTASQVIEEAGVSVPGGAAISFNGVPIGLSTILSNYQENNILLITPNAKAGR